MSTTITGPDVGHSVDTSAPPVPTNHRGAWWRLYRHHLRLVRGAAIAWIVALSGISVGVVATFEDRHSDPAELAILADMEGIPAFEAMLGRFVEPATVEGLTLSRWGIFAVLAAVWGMLAGCRLLRGAEERGLLEQLRAGTIGPRGLVASALAAIVTTHAVLAVVIGASHAAAGMDPVTSWALGGAMALLASTFAAIGVLASQVMATERGAVGLAGSVLGLFLGLRVVAAAGATPDWTWWTTPFGWVGFLHPADDALVAVFTALSILLVVLVTAALLSARRDLHAGFGGDGTTSARRPRPIRGHTHLAVRLSAAGVRTWGAVVGIVALTFGLLARDFADAVAEMDTMIALAAQMGWAGIDTTEGVVAFTFSIVALLVAVFAAGQAVAIREEEASWRIEHLLVRPLGRTRWLATRVAVSAGAVVVVALIAGLAAFAGTAFVGRPVAAGDALAAALNVVPLAWATLGLGVALLAILPRLTGPLTYGLVVATYLLDFVGGLLELPESVLDLSPFRQLAPVPAVDAELVPLVVMALVGLAGVLVGLVVFRRRDLQEA